MTRVDLHLHSRFSRRSEAWVLRKANLAKSYSDPETLYQRLRNRGFTHFTLTDHHTLEGCLRLEGRPGVFFSEQATASFPEDGTPVELLIWGLTREQHSEIQELRANIYELRAYLHQQNLAHAVAHPFFATPNRLQTVHVEKLLLLFRHFEVRCGIRAPLVNQFAESFLRRLTPQHLQQIAERHEIAPTHERPWEKVFIGGSGDEGGLSAGRAWTSTPPAESTEQLLAHLQEGRCQPEGHSGGALFTTLGLCNNLCAFLTESVPAVRQSALVQSALAKLIAGQDPTRLDWPEWWQLVKECVFSGKIFALMNPANASLRRALGALARSGGGSRAISCRLQGITEPEERVFVLFNIFTDRLVNHLVSSLAARLTRGNPLHAAQELALFLPVLAPIAAYLFELRREYPDREWLHTLSTAITGDRLPELSTRKTAWFTDTLGEINGVSRTICSLAEAAAAQGIPLTVLSCSNHSDIDNCLFHNFKPIRDFGLPEYEFQRLAIPPVLEIFEYLSRNAFTEVLLSTPGPMGLVGLLAAKILRLPVRGIYHTDFPRYVRILADDPYLEALAWKYMRWFYKDLDELLVNSEPYRQAWIARGVTSSKIRILPRGVDTTQFGPTSRSPDFWSHYGVPQNQRMLLYVGRVSKEKDLDILVETMGILREHPFTLAIVGDGPYVPELRTLLPKAVFTGPLTGKTLAKAYASADLFVFPSTTDTFGNVVLEALASGLPCVVSDTGGPAKLIESGKTGFITRSRDPGDLSLRILQILEDPAMRSRMTEQALRSVKKWDWHRAALKLFLNN